MDKAKFDDAREQTRQLAVKGLWSFFIPLGLAYTAAVLLVQEMDYIRVETDLDGVVNKHMVRRIVVGPGRFSVSRGLIQQVLGHNEDAYILSLIQHISIQ